MKNCIILTFILFFTSCGPQEDPEYVNFTYKNQFNRKIYIEYFKFNELLDSDTLLANIGIKTYSKDVSYNKLYHLINYDSIVLNFDNKKYKYYKPKASFNTEDSTNIYNIESYDKLEYNNYVYTIDINDYNMADTIM